MQILIEKNNINEFLCVHIQIKIAAWWAVAVQEIHETHLIIKIKIDQLILSIFN